MRIFCLLAKKIIGKNKILSNFVFKFLKVKLNMFEFVYTIILETRDSWSCLINKISKFEITKSYYIFSNLKESLFDIYVERFG